MKPIKRKKLTEEKDAPKGSTVFTKGDKEVVYGKSYAHPGKVLKVKFDSSKQQKGKKAKGKYISEKKAERQIKRKRSRIARRNK